MTADTPTETCPDCKAVLPKVDGPTHRYLGASASCWAMYLALSGGGEPPIAPGPFNALLVDTYAVQHPGVPSNQAIQSVAVHLLTLYGVLERGVPVERAVWLRTRPLREGAQHKHQRFVWLTPPSFVGSLKIADIVAAPTPQARAERAKDYVDNVWSIWWQTEHAPTLVQWYEQYVVPEKI
jgi:hypothetical protein